MLALGIILAHLAGDYLLQNDWMAQQKTTRWLPAIVHGLVYTLPYILVTQSIPALLVIASSHMVIDRFRLAKHFIWAVNQLTPKNYRYTWAEAKANAGYTAAKPVWMSVWLMIIIDNTIHLLINTAAVVWL